MAHLPTKPKNETERREMRVRQESGVNGRERGVKRRGHRGGGKEVVG